jgi:hypothetical protein
MKGRDLSRYLLSISAAAALLAGCGGSQPQPPIGAPGAIPQTSALATRVDRGRSWMEPNLAGRDLLYVGDFYTGDVFVYDYPTLKEVGTLTGFDSPEGMCVDKRGDVYVTNEGDDKVEVFKHGGSHPFKTYQTNGVLIGCSVDRSGDLAVTTGYLCVFKAGSPNETCYSPPEKCYDLRGPAYDNLGNIFVEGEGGICVLLAGASLMTTLSYNGVIGYPAAAIWDGKYMALTDNEDVEEIQRVKLTGPASLTEVSTTFLTDDCDSNYTSVEQPFIVGKKNTPENDEEGTVVLGGNGWCSGRGYGKVDLWKYPKGGMPFRYVHDSPLHPSGQAVSLAIGK